MFSVWFQKPGLASCSRKERHHIPTPTPPNSPNPMSCVTSETYANVDQQHAGVASAMCAHARNVITSPLPPERVQTKKNELIRVPKTLHGRDSRRWPCSKHKNDAPRRENCNVSKKGSWSEKLHRICNGFGVSTRTHVRNYSGRNVEWRLCGSRLKAWYIKHLLVI